ncbi:tRNA threonylcarbamoyladenosine dehydratase [Xylophilus ampelinus]|uniref:tRNA A37 threonylcarbamoyladenosine dehydratase n=1 Tax=Xylophilus ampelinus TaxID=54067 RepID=A0A318SXQ2_9BURK|nr:ThiF family adenylyltransferase [Xylophilus ampelinus]MCS4509177.1 ThiF family adenylyltransferase [Xylophilus ampelinus]PYE79797.1 tRNA A37 threonylcarbamoyladenosine dehydratase [Xylophilus ampelinus]
MTVSVALGGAPVTPVLPDDADAARRFGGLERLYGVDGAQRIRHSRVAVVGIGGVGSWTAEALARSGVAGLVLIDLDHISESNVNRQIHALTPTVGQAKILAMRDRIALINPDCIVHCVDDFVELANWPGLLPCAVDAVVDACDQVQAKVAMADWARRQGKHFPFVSVGAAGGKRQAHLVDLDDLSATTHDPLLARLRYRLRRAHGAPHDGKPIGIRCVFSREAVAPPDASCAIDGDGSLNCHGYGSVVSVTATFGMVAAGWVLDRLAARCAAGVPGRP